MGDTFFDSRTMPTIVCCMCGTPMASNPSNMCVNCIRGQVDITDGIPKQLTIHFCRGCERYFQPPNHWLVAALESRELLATCLKRIRGLNKVKLIDAGFVWTEPHSKRIKVKLTIQKEVFSSTILQQSFVVEFIVASQQCKDCQRTEADLTWRAVAQVRQKVPHKRTFFFLEQLMLKHEAHTKCNSIKELPDGLDFYFNNRSHALKLVEFIGTQVPIRYKTAKELISHDIHTSTYNYKFTYSVEIAPVCKDDLLCLTKSLARSLGNISPLVLCTRVSGQIHVLDPVTLQSAEISPDVYWRSPFRAIAERNRLVPFVVIDIDPVGHYAGKHCLADAVVVREADFGKNDTQFLTRTHMGNILNPGDSVLGFDIRSANFNDADTTSLNGLEIPDVVLVKKIYPDRPRRRNRKWKLKSIVTDDSDLYNTRGSLEKRDEDYEEFLQEIEEDPEMRANMKLFKAGPREAFSESDSEVDGIRYDELLDDFEGMNLEDAGEGAAPAEPQEMEDEDVDM